MSNFIANKIESDVAKGTNGSRVVTRFPPEPNGYLHLGHAKSINLNFGLASAFGGVTHLRMDDTNPTSENMEFINAILNDVRWLVNTDTSSVNQAPWHGSVRYASDYFPQMYLAAEWLIERGSAYVDDLSAEEIREYRGTLTTSGRDSPYRTRTVSENLELFRKMKAGDFSDGHCVLRAKIDMSSANMNLRDPALYRIKSDAHPMTGTQWRIYPMYDFAHAISDALEGITHSLCSLEFEDHRPLYDWVLDNIWDSGLLPNTDKGWRPVQTEFARLNLQYTVLSKRKLVQLVSGQHVDGWDDPRLPTLCGVRRRGLPPKAIRMFCDRIGVSKAANNIDMTVLEDCAREVLDQDTPRALAVQRPLLVTITNWPKGAVEILSAEKHPKRAEFGTREIPISEQIYIDMDDFFDTGPDGQGRAPPGFKRLVPGGTVRLKYAFVIRCDAVVRDASGLAVELLCTYDAATRAGLSPTGSFPSKGIVQWVSKAHGLPIEIVMYDRLFLTPSPGKAREDSDFLNELNPNSIARYPAAIVERSVAGAACGAAFQFERMGYFCRDITDGKDGKLKFNRIVTLRDTWANSVETVSTTAASSPSKSQPIAEALKAADKVTAPVTKSSNANASTNASMQSDSIMEDVLRVDLRVGLILSAKQHPDADNLYVEQVDCGDPTGPRTIISGLAKHIPLESMVGRRVVVVCNLKPAKMRGIVSEGMLLAAASGPEGSETVELVTAPDKALAGESIRIAGYGAPRPDAQLKSKSALDAWKRVTAKLVTDRSCMATFALQPLLTSAGPCFVRTLADAMIR